MIIHSHLKHTAVKYILIKKLTLNESEIKILREERV